MSLSTQQPLHLLLILPGVIVIDSVAFICGPQRPSGSQLNPFPNFDSIAISQGRVLGEKTPAIAPREQVWDIAQQSWNTDIYFRDNYYDLALCQYINHFRTGDNVFLQYARKTADAWWGSQWIDNGTVVQGPNNLPPRSMAYAGLMLRALDGRPEMWDYIERQVHATFDNWVKQRIGDPSLYYDIREDGYAQLYAVLLAHVLPDSYPLYGDGTTKMSTGEVAYGATKRVQYLADTEQAAVMFFGALQKPSGAWRWDIPGTAVNTEQPFMTGLYLESVGRLYELTHNEEVKASLKKQLIKSVDYLYARAYDNSVVTDFPQWRWRAMVYFIGGGTPEAPQLYEYLQPKGVAGWDGAMRAERQRNVTLLHAFGRAFQMTGDIHYLVAGDELFGACFGDNIDSLMALAGLVGGKEYAQAYRAGGQYLALRLAPQVPTEYLDLVLTGNTDEAHTKLYQKMFPRGYAAWSKEKGKVIRFRRMKP